MKNAVFYQGVEFVCGRFCYSTVIFTLGVVYCIVDKGLNSTPCTL